MALLEGLKVPLQYGLDIMDVETDARNVGLAVKSQNLLFMEGSIIKDIHVFLNSFEPLTMSATNLFLVIGKE